MSKKILINFTTNGNLFYFCCYCCCCCFCFYCFRLRFLQWIFSMIRRLKFRRRRLICFRGCFKKVLLFFLNLRSIDFVFFQQQNRCVFINFSVVTFFLQYSRLSDFLKILIIIYDFFIVNNKHIETEKWNILIFLSFLSFYIFFYLPD